MAHIIRGRYAAAKTSDENRRHWLNADLLSPVAAASPGVRKTVRSRARYEIANNSIARGIVNTLANDVVGTGPRLQVLTDDDEINRRLEGYFAQWAQAVRLPEKLRTMRKAKAQDGEAFAVLVTNRGLDSPVKLDVRLIEADRVTTPRYGVLEPSESRAVDGIRFDEDGNPKEYHILRAHPGARRATLQPFEKFDRVPAANVIHWFTADRPEQRRGLPDIMPALPLFAQLRRFTLATLTAAETAADLSIVMKTTSPAGGEAAEVDPWVTMEIDRNTAMFAPEGWEPTQLKAEHPGETFEPFRKAIINEIARCVNMPYNIAAANSAGYNYASGRLDHEMYFKAIAVERSELTAVALNRIFVAWLTEAIRVADYGIFGLIERIFWPHGWLWAGREEIDPRWARVHIDLVKNGLETEADYHALRGADWSDKIDQREREKDRRTAAGLPQPWEKQGAAK